MISIAVLLISAVAINAATFPIFDPKIVGGEDTTIVEYPYQISLQYYGRHNCGGSIISERYVITAAHCTEGYTLSGLTVRVGADIHSTGGRVIKIAKTIEHPSYVGSTYDNDISILELAEDIVFSDVAQPITLSTSEPQDADKCVVTGWGHLKENGASPKLLQKVEVPVVSRSSCRKLYDQSGAPPVTDNMVCAGYLQGGMDSCQGDSGGPLAGNGELKGVVSWGKGCARPNYPGVYTNVVLYRSWIKEHTGV